MATLKSFDFEKLLVKIQSAIDDDFINRFARQSMFSKEKAVLYIKTFTENLKSNSDELKSYQFSKKHHVI